MVHRRSLVRLTKSFYQSVLFYRDHDMAMLYGQLRGKQKAIVPIGARLGDFGLME